MSKTKSEKSKTEKSKSKTRRPLLPLLVPSAPGEAGIESPGVGRVRELSLTEAVNMLCENPAEFSFSVLELTKILKQVRLVPWREEEQIRPALYLKDRTLAAYVRYFVRLAGEAGIGRCPKCGKWFLQTKPTHVYDIIAHRESHRVKLWREGKKKCLNDTDFTLSRYNFRVTFLGRVPTSYLAHSYSHNRGPCSGG